MLMEKTVIGLGASSIESAPPIIPQIGSRFQGALFTRIMRQGDSTPTPRLMEIGDPNPYIPSSA